MAVSPEIIDKLNQLYSDKYYSFAGQILQAAPYVPDNLRPALELIEEIYQTEHEQAEKLSALITALEGVPEPLPPDAYFIEINYLSLSYILPRLINRQEEVIDACRQLLAQCHSHSEIEDLLKQIIAQDKEFVVKIRSYLPVTNEK